MEKLPIAWVERIFERLECIYKQNWIVNEKNKSLLLTQWSTGLCGLSGKEIQKALTVCEFSNRCIPPTVMEFYHFAKGIKSLPRHNPQSFGGIGSKEIASKYLQEIKQKL